MPQFYLNCDFLPVPVRFVEEYMPGANAAFVKVYLFAMNAAAKSQSVEFSDIANALNLLESDVVQAFNYWKEKGILEFDDKGVFFVSSKKETAAKPAPEKIPAKDNQNRPIYEPGEVARAISANSTLSEMVSLSQEILGKTLNPADVETLYWFYDGLKFSPEVILMILEYCVSKEKRRMNYIEKVAVAWHEKGIVDMEAVDDYIKKESERTGFIYSVRKLLGIADRALSQSEEQFINRWKDMYKMDADMISLAYENCIIQTAKLSFPYMEKILERWYKQGIHTPAEAQEDNRNFRNKNTSVKSEADYEIYSDDYDHASLEYLTRKK